MDSEFRILKERYERVFEMKMNDFSALTPIDFLHASRILQIAVTSVIHPAVSYEIRAHRPCEICIVKHGNCIMHVAGEDVPMKEGEFIFILPYVSHRFTTLTDSPCEVFYVHFNLDFLNNPLYQLPKVLKLDLKQYFILYASHYIWGQLDFQLESCIHNIQEEYQIWLHSSISMMNYYVFELVLLLSRRIHSQFPVNIDYHNPYVEQALTYIHEHYTEHLTAADIAKHLKISIRYLNRLFHDHTHSTILDYINSCRINQSVLLIAKGYPLTYIAVTVGFSSPPHYTKVFKKYMGVTPREYRRALSDTV